MPSIPFLGSLRPRVALALLFIMRGFILGNWIARIPAIAEHLEVSRTELGTVLIAGAIGALIAFQTAAPRISQIGTARAIAIFGGGWVLAFPLAVSSPAPWVFFAVLLAYGFFNGTTDVALNAQAVEIERRIGTPILSSMHGMFSVGALIGTAVGGGLAALGVGIGPQFLTISLVLLALWVALNPCLVPDERVETPATPRTRRPIFSIGPRVLWPLGAIAFCCGLIEEALADWGALYLSEDLRTNPGTAAMGYTIFSLTMLVGRLSGDRLVRATGPVMVLRAGSALGAVGMLFGIGVNTPWSFLVSFALAGLGFAAIIPIVYRAAGSTPGIDRAAGVAAVATACYSAFLIGPPVMGFIADVASLRAAFALVGIIVTTVIVLAPSVTQATQEPSTTDTPSPIGAPAATNQATG
jgi:MFS family permease